tara:strand:+ start:454 stop:1278 length:825 start_codon:yes stop_codon:yes gene_type:complete
VAVEIANLIVTLPSWGITDHPLADALAKAGPKYWVNVQISPTKTLQLTNDAKQRAALRELADWDEVKDKRALNLIAANPESPEALIKFDDLVLAIKLRVQRLKYSACDDDTALAFSEVLRACDVDRVGPQEILVPVKTPGSGMELAKRITERAEDNELCLVLEEVEESGSVARQLIAARQKVVRLPIFNGVKQPVEQIPANDLPIYVLVNDVSSVSSTVDGFNRAAKDVAGLVWVTSNPGLAAYALKKCSGTRSMEVPSLNADEILNKISTDNG